MTDTLEGQKGSPASSGVCLPACLSMCLYVCLSVYQGGDSRRKLGTGLSEQLESQ